MNAVAEFALSAGRFFYSFLVGDDWIVAAVMIVALVVTALLARSGGNAWWLVPALAVGMTAVSLYRHHAAA